MISLFPEATEVHATQRCQKMQRASKGLLDLSGTTLGTWNVELGEKFAKKYPSGDSRTAIQ